MMKKQSHAPSLPFMTRRGKNTCRKSPDNIKKTSRRHNAKEDRMMRALEAIRLLSFDIPERSKDSSPTTPRTVTTLCDDEASEEIIQETRKLMGPNTEAELPALRPLSLIDRNSSSSGGTRSAFLRSESNVSYLSSDTSSEIGERLSDGGDHEDYPMYISFSRSSAERRNSDEMNNIGASSRRTNSRRLSTSALEEWNRKCDEEDGVFRREKYASDMLNNLNQNKLVERNLDRRNSCPVSPIDTDLYGHWHANFDETEDEDISLTYSHDE